jgi:hypothetical protein
MNQGFTRDDAAARLENLALWIASAKTESVRVIRLTEAEAAALVGDLEAIGRVLADPGPTAPPESPAA